MDLKKKTLKGLFWSGIDSLGLNVARVVITVILARILDPEDFGLIALLTVFITFSDTLVQGGFVQALIRKPSVAREDYSTVFIFNLALSVIIYAVIFFCSPLIAAYFEQPALDLLAKVVALVIIFHSLSIVQDVSLRRDVNFKVLSVIHISTTVVSGLIAIAMAFSGYGIWSLVAQVVLKSVLTTLLLWLFGSWKLEFGFSRSSFSENFQFGYKVMLSNLINNLSNSLYDLVIGKVYSADRLGLFYQAKKLSSAAHSIISKVFNDVSFPVLSSVQEDASKLRRYYLQFLRSVSFVSFPVMILLLITASPLIHVFLTDKWAEAVPYFQLFCISGMLLPPVVLSGHVPLIKGRSDLYLKLELFYKAQLIIALLITVNLGVKAMVIGMVIQVMIQFVINLYFAGKLTGITISEQLMSMRNIAGISIAAAFIVYYLLNYLSSDPYILLFQIPVYLLLYIAMNYFFKTKELLEVKKIFSKKLNTGNGRL